MTGSIPAHPFTSSSRLQKSPAISFSRNSRLLALLSSVLLLSASLSISQWAWSFDSVRTLRAEDLPGANLGEKIAAADARLGADPGVILVSSEGQIRTGLTLHTGHALELRAPIEWGATVILQGKNDIACTGRGSIHSTLPAYAFPGPTGMLLSAHHASQIHVRDCRVSGTAPSVVLAGYPMSDVSMEGNILDGLSLAATNEGTSLRLRFRNNSVVFPAGNNGVIGLSLFFAKGVDARDNRFKNMTHGIEWWGGDSGAAGSNLAQVTAAGEMEFSGNSCSNVQGSCIWGSMGYAIKITGNTADGCGDVCFDSEGGKNVSISGNTASGCANGCAATFFFGKGISVTNNHFRGQSPGGGLIFIKNASQNPAAHQGFVVTDNELRCEPGICRALYAEAVSGLRFERNQVTNGIIQPMAYASSVTIARNRFTFTLPLIPGASAISAPAVIGGTTLEIWGNQIVSTAAQPASSACITAAWSDFNNSDFHLVAKNLCGGTHPFPIDVATTTDGKNPGPHALWFLSNNILGSNHIVHTAVTSNERYLDFGECTAATCQPNPGALATLGDRTRPESLPACVAEKAGLASLVAGKSGQADTIQVCVRSDDASYSWRSLDPAP